jgi:hypothetical protein
VPMCQSPKIDDVLLRARKIPANDDYAPVETSMKSSKPACSFKAVWQAFLIFLCVTVSLLF